MPTLDLDAYLQRIGFVGPRSPDLATLKAVVLAHAQGIAFENIDPFLGREVHLDVESLQRKLVHGGRGGYCFEQNLLLEHALRSLGYQTTGLAGRVLWMRPEGAVTTRSHMLLRVDLDGKTYLVDVGFGGMTLTGVLEFESDLVQPTPHESYRLLRDDDTFLMQTCVGDRWRTLYRFDLHPELLPDYDMTNWYLSNHPQSQFVTGLIVARPDVGRRYALRGAELTEHHLDGRVDRRTLSDVGELRGELEETFGLTLPSGPEVDETLQYLF